MLQKEDDPTAIGAIPYYEIANCGKIASRTFGTNRACSYDSTRPVLAESFFDCSVTASHNKRKVPDPRSAPSLGG